MGSKIKIPTGDLWRKALAEWAIPEEILGQAEESPWIHPPVLFDLPKVIEDSPSHQRAREAISDGASVLDIGCGGGIAAFALAPIVKKVIGVDHQPEMLNMFATNAEKFGCEVQVIEGFWPAVAEKTPSADVVVSHHVAYNVPEIEDFVIALNEKATNRVVIEIPQQHPLTNLSGLWKQFWNLERPSEPTANLLNKIVRELGFNSQIINWDGEMRGEIDLDQAAEFNRIRLCLPKTRLAEVRRYMELNPPKSARKLATIWWDK